MEWKSIDSLPRDGKMVLLYDPKTKAYKVGNHPENYLLGIWFYDKREKEWYGSSFYPLFNPMFYMELPKPPKVVKEKELTNQEIVNGLNSINFDRIMKGK